MPRIERKERAMKHLICKIGGSIIQELPDSFYRIFIALKEAGWQPIIVHGGGPEINEALDKWQVSTKFVDGLRVTTPEVLQVAETILSGSINKVIVGKLLSAGVPGIGISGVDGQILKASPIHNDGKLGFVGKVDKVNTAWLNVIMNEGGIPVLSPIGIDDKGQKYNINADMAAAAVAKSFKGNLAFISDIPGVMQTKKSEQIIHDKLTERQIHSLIDEGVIYGGMIPKVTAAINALNEGVHNPVILNGYEPEELLRYVKGQSAGTQIIREKEVYHA
jgi:acetylglutamate kinase